MPVQSHTFGHGSLPSFNESFFTNRKRGFGFDQDLEDSSKSKRLHLSKHLESVEPASAQGCTPSPWLFSDQSNDMRAETSEKYPSNFHTQLSSGEKLRNTSQAYPGSFYFSAGGFATGATSEPFDHLTDSLNKPLPQAFNSDSPADLKMEVESPQAFSDSDDERTTQTEFCHKYCGYGESSPNSRFTRCYCRPSWDAITDGLIFYSDVY